MELNDRYLTEVCKDFDFKNPQVDPIEFAKDLVKTMYEKNGLGLAANQVGYPWRVFAMRGSPENFVCYNPKIVKSSEAEVSLEEGCLTFPGLLVKIKRPQHIRVRFTTPNGDTRTETFTGMSARVFQHELDHLDGIRFFDRANRFHRDKALKKWRDGHKTEMRIRA
jgi:peptide deformylase